MERFHIKRTWQKCTDEHVLEVFDRVASVAEFLYPACFTNGRPQLFIDSSTTHLGRCELWYDKSFYHSVSEMRTAVGNHTVRYSHAVILLSKFAPQTDESLLSTICHEFGHFVSPGENHGYYWQVRTRNIAKQFGVSCERLATTDETIQFKDNIKAHGIVMKEKIYAVECPNCHATWKRKIMSDLIKYPGNYRCTKCNIALIRKEH